MTLYAHFSPTTSASLLLRRTIKSKPPRCCSSIIPTAPPSTLSSLDQTHRLVVILGATGSGKTRLSLDLASALSAENINSDKMQLYKGLDITTNQLPLSRRRGVPHHLLGQLDPSTELTPSAYRDAAHSIITQISARHTLPILVGGSNSFIHALLSPTFDPTSDVFSHPFPPISPHLRYRCCFLWVDVSPPVLDQYLTRRVDDMIREGMLDELEDFFSFGGSHAALRKAIGVPEFSDYFRKEREERLKKQVEYDVAVRKVKDNTCVLARKQRGKIQRFMDAGWDLQRVDSTEVLSDLINTAEGDDVWERRVLRPSLEIVRNWLRLYQ